MAEKHHTCRDRAQGLDLGHFPPCFMLSVQHANPSVIYLCIFRAPAQLPAGGGRENTEFAGLKYFSLCCFFRQALSFFDSIPESR